MSTVHLVYPDPAAATDALAAAGLAARDAGGKPVLPSVLFLPSGRVDITVEGGGTGILYRPTGEMRPGPVMPDGRPGPPAAVYAPLPGFRLAVTGEGLPDFGAAVSTEGGSAVLAPAPAAPPAPPDISDAQFGQGLWRAGIIAYADYLAFVGPGVIPPPLLAIVQTLPDDDTGAPTPRKLATADLMGRKLYEFANPLVEYVRAAMEKSDPRWTPAYLRQEWSSWATL